MEKLILLLGLVLSMAGCDRLDGHTVTVRSRENGVDTLYSEVLITPSLAVFHCIAASGGRCHYQLFQPGCQPGSSCQASPLRRFTVPAGERLFDTGLPADIQPCVSERDDARAPLRCQASRTG